MVISSHPEFSTQKVIAPEEVEHYTSQGWRIRQTFQTSVPISYVSQAAEYGSPANNYQNVPEKRAEQVALVTMILVARVRDDEMAELRERAAKVSEAAETCEYHRGVAEERAKKSAEAEAKATEAAAQAHSRETNTMDRCRLAEQRARDMEQKARDTEKQIAKLRKALGDLRMNEILGSE